MANAGLFAAVHFLLASHKVMFAKLAFLTRDLDFRDKVRSAALVGSREITGYIESLDTSNALEKEKEKISVEKITFSAALLHLLRYYLSRCPLPIRPLAQLLH